MAWEPHLRPLVARVYLKDPVKECFLTDAMALRMLDRRNEEILEEFSGAYLSDFLR